MGRLHEGANRRRCHARRQRIAPIHTATTVRLRDGKRQVQDGPFAESKEQLGGYFIIEVPNLDVALEWAAQNPAATRGAVEVRPIFAM